MKKSLLIHPEELTRKWVDRMKQVGCNILALHPTGGGNAHESARRLEKLMENEEFCSLLDYAAEQGLSVEYEMHSMGYLLPKELFEMHPEYFRMNEAGERVADGNFCTANEEAMDLVAENAAAFAKKLYRSTNRYFFWLDDVPGIRCHCEKCRALSASDQQLIAVNAMVKGIRRYNRNARLCYLAYMDAIHCPQKVAPANGVFLEYAPFYRDSHRPLFDETCEKNVREVAALRDLLSLFGTQHAQVLEYWMDNSRFSNWTKPPKAMTLDEAVMREDVKFYEALGFESITSFGCYLGADYRELHGAAPVQAYGDILREARAKTI